MRIGILWTHPSGYSSACWRSLQAIEGVQLKVWAYSSNEPSVNAPFDDCVLLQGIDSVLLNRDQAKDSQRIGRSVIDFNPTVLLVSGWSNKAYCKAVRMPELHSVAKVMAMDNPWSGSARQHLTCLMRRRYLEKFGCVWVAGERTRQFARRISSHVPIRNGVYSFNLRAFDGFLAKRQQQSYDWPKRFLFVGRYVECKGIRLLLEAYEAYRQSVSEPWELHFCGTGPLKGLIEGKAGVTNLGFRQPSELAGAFESAGAFVLPSQYEPWGVVVAEAMAAGLPVIASDACGATVELLRDNYNGFVFDPRSRIELQHKLLWCHENRARLHSMSCNAIASASAFSSELWAERFIGIVSSISGSRNARPATALGATRQRGS